MMAFLLASTAALKIWQLMTGAGGMVTLGAALLESFVACGWLMRRLAPVSALLTIVICLGGIGLAWLQPEKSCGCLGDVQLGVNGHLVLAGLTGFASTVLFSKRTTGSASAAGR